MARRRIYAFTAAPILLLLGGGLAWGLWPTASEPEPIPAQLEELDAPETGAADVRVGPVLSAQGPLPELPVETQEGRKVVLLVQGKESFGGKEGHALKRALNRWVLPDDVDAYIVGDAGPVPALLGPMIEREFVGPMREEARFPIYVDFGSTVSEAYKLPKGHIGLVIIDEQGEVVMRHSGDAQTESLAEIREALGATEPAPGPPAPAFEIGGLHPGRCLGEFCTFVFLDEKIARGDVPGIEGGFEGDDEEAFAQIKKTSVRLARVLVEDWEMSSEKSLGVVVGELDGFDLPGWKTVSASSRQATALRAAFELPDEEPALVVLDRDGRIAFRMSGTIPFYQLGNAADVMGIEGKAFDSEEDD